MKHKIERLVNIALAVGVWYFALKVIANMQ